MFKSRYLFSVLFCFVWMFNAKATHNRAGEITYKWVGPSPYRYEIKITTYTNIGSAQLADRCFDTLYFGDGTSAALARSNGPSTICGSAGAQDGIPITYNIKLNEYITFHTFPGPGSYKMSMEDPNRNGGIVNIPNSILNVFYIESYLVIPTFGSHNSSPDLSFPPIDNACINNCFYHNPGAYDLDGDSISYELTECRGSSGATCPGYSYPPHGGGSFSLDSITGTLTWCNPQLQGEYNMAMIIKEWRLDDDGNYFLIGYVLRDMQVDVGACINNHPEIIINNINTVVTAGSNFSTTISSTDIDGELIKLSAKGRPFTFGSDPATFNSMPNTFSTTGSFDWSTSYNHVQRMPYQITLKAEDNDPMVSFVRFNTFTIKVIPDAPLNLAATPANNHIRLNWNKPLSYSTTSSNPFVKYRVYRKSGISNWVPLNNETAPPAYTGFSYIGYTNNTITDTLFFDFNGGNSFSPGQDYSYVVLAEYRDGSTSRVSNIVSNQIYVSVKEMSLNNSSVSISPNPIIENFTVSFNTSANELYTITLYDITGRKIKTYLNNEPVNNQNSISLKLENINQGIYFIKISDGKQTITKKIIKQ